MLLNSYKKDGRKLSHKESEYIRISSVKSVREKGMSPEKVIAFWGLNRVTIYKWLKKFDEGGWDALKSRKAKGPDAKACPSQKQLILADLFSDPSVFGYSSNFWTRPLIKEHLEKYFKISYSQAQIGRILREFGIPGNSLNNNECENRNEALMQQWIKDEYSKIKIVAAQEQRNIYFLLVSEIIINEPYGLCPEFAKNSNVIQFVSLVSQNGKMLFRLYKNISLNEMVLDFFKKISASEFLPVSIITDADFLKKNDFLLSFLSDQALKMRVYPMLLFSGDSDNCLQENFLTDSLTDPANPERTKSIFSLTIMKLKNINHWI